MATNQKFINMMVNQPNNALMRKFTHLGTSLLLWYHTELGEIAGSSAKALEELIDLQINKSALRAAGIVCDPEREKKLKQQAEEALKLIPYYVLVALFGHVQGLQAPEEQELASFKDSLRYQVSFDIKGTPWEEESDLFHIFPKRSKPQDRVLEFLLRKIHTHRKSPLIYAFLKWLPTRISRHFILRGWDVELGNERPIPLVINPELLERIISWVAWLFLAPCITVLPMFVLYAIPSTWVRIAAVWAFSQVFVISVSILSNDLSNRGYIFSTNAAFCAVLAVFVGNAPS